jgi:hypothetical protein
MNNNNQLPEKDTILTNIPAHGVGRRGEIRGDWLKKMIGWRIQAKGFLSGGV